MSPVLIPIVTGALVAGLVIIPNLLDRPVINVRPRSGPRSCRVLVALFLLGTVYAYLWADPGSAESAAAATVSLLLMATVLVLGKSRSE